ncbi:hypothetical protein [Streptomyces sp. NBC_01296]|uniref:hypothetical protein n=1 Tax=Streptomyces sp. NBC_01296 TaxID=2903816 RepID=UPI002E136693|nr:hypothetical protein OG299_01730 [Streptomyces sp. NBC_01296]
MPHIGGRPLVRCGVSLVHVLEGVQDAQDAEGPEHKTPVGDQLRILATFSMPSSTTVLSLRRERYEPVRMVRQISSR